MLASIDIAIDSQLTTDQTRLVIPEMNTRGKKSGKDQAELGKPEPLGKPVESPQVGKMVTDLTRINVLYLCMQANIGVQLPSVGITYTIATSI